jgi:Stf0 sulphotransferase
LKKILILFTPRSGSTLFADDLSVNKIGNVFEVFYRRDYRFLKTEVSLLAEDLDWSSYQKVFDAYTVNDVFCTKLNYTAALNVDVHFGDGSPGSGLVKVFGRDCVVLIMQREDILSQAASLYVASSTNKWSGEMVTDDEIADLLCEREELWNRLMIRANEISTENFLLRILVRQAGFSNVTHLLFEDYLANRIEYLARVAKSVEMSLGSISLSNRTKYSWDFIGPVLDDFKSALLSRGYVHYCEYRAVPESFVKGGRPIR